MNWNTLKTTILLGLLTGMLLVFGKLLGGNVGMVIALFMAAIMNFGSWYFSDKIVLSMYGVRLLEKEDAPVLHEIVEKLAKNAGIPKPKVGIAPMDVPNAFATGRNPENGVVVVTPKIVELLDQDELEGVLAHEIAHIKNRDTLIQAVAATIGGAITTLANMAQWFLLFGGARREEEDGSWAEVIGTILMVILAPIAATLIQMAISRSREYKADETGGMISGKPEALASALKKLEEYSMRIPPEIAKAEVNPATSHLFIVNPLKGDTIAALFSTHPPTEERVRRLLELAKRLFGRIRETLWRW
ncbi:protease htpX [Desulfurobacterium thermolithotrophum DSM 11699]|uniref:Protease HtpX homolog n=1 Tax=Desulfurobacterium thermolithotrophum (strain DSM 11699 / BSA) TaxID=868864 RepID=F0S2I9_DESTD|nr:zinc metalloprotease HtpX [Desulfurobacterium thermolithotrophum]ADY73061.1 protease htpX [Desulfurobacterium thermolithotrophum DSM 11699]